MADALRTVLVTGGSGFIGSALCRHLVALGGYRVVNVDKLTYCGNADSLRDLTGDPAYCFYQSDIADEGALLEIMGREAVDAVVHLAAETHVDRSIRNAEPFVQTNVLGTMRLLDATLRHWRGLAPDSRSAFRFHHVSTDEVFGDARDGEAFCETSAYAPSSPYAASKAASDHLVRAWHRTYGLPVVLSSSSNNYGPYQYPEKLIPLMIVRALEERPLPLYGDGGNVRDWLFVYDHVRALENILRLGTVGRAYLVGARTEMTNLALVSRMCDRLDRKRPPATVRRRRDLIAFVEDRPGHDRRYSVDPSRIEGELGWRAETPVDKGLDRTIDWYLANEHWWRPAAEQAT